MFADIDPATFNLDPAAVDAAVTERTRAIVAVHLCGQPADLPALREIADRHGLALIEDAAQAYGARCDGRPVGTFGDAATFSFFPSKNLPAMGDAGDGPRCATATSPTASACCGSTARATSACSSSSG